jgi:hypothetical protein
MVKILTGLRIDRHSPTNRLDEAGERARIDAGGQALSNFALAKPFVRLLPNGR